MGSFNKLAKILILLAFLLLGCAQTSIASIQEITLQNGLVVNADFRQGNPKLPALIILHGFLSTRNFLTVSSLIESLAEENYPILAPNLSLGVNKRNKTLACEAIHTHDMDSDLEEINQWVEFLHRFGYHDIVIIGHSYGSLHGLLYVNKYPKQTIKKLVAASLVDVEHVVGIEKSASQIAFAKSLISQHDNSLHEYQVSYCKKYIAPASAFLSYASWSQKQILSAIKRSKTPLEIILGAKDKRMGENWPNILKNNGLKLQVIDNANHFFNNEQEIDLLDSVLKALKGL